jgi:hypothetical protein
MMNATPKKPETPAALEGTTAHELCASLLEISCQHGHYNTHASYYSASHSKETGMEYTAEMVECAERYKGYVSQYLAPKSLNVETKLEMPMLGANVWGTSDVWGISGDTLHVIDYKHGHRPVDVIRNLQGVCYILGALQYLTKEGRAESIRSVAFHIFQPRARHRDGVGRVWSLSLETLYGFIKPMAQAVFESSQPDAPVRSGSHCRDCDARLVCPAALEAGVQLYEAVWPGAPEESTIEQKAAFYALLLRAEEHIKGMKTGYEEEIVATIKSGQVVPGYELQRVFGRAKWSKSDEEVLNLGKMFNIDLSKQSVTTPKDAVKLGLPESLLTSYTEKPDNGYKLVPFDAERVNIIFGGK